MKTAALQELFEEWKEVKHSGNGRIWPHLICCVLFKVDFSVFFSSPYCCPACWLWHQYPLGLFNLSVTDSSCVVFAAGPPPSTAQNAT